MQQLLAGMIPVGEDGSFAFRTVIPEAINYTVGFHEAFVKKGPHKGTINIGLGEHKYKGTYRYDGNDGCFIDVTGNVNDQIN